MAAEKPLKKKERTKNRDPLREATLALVTRNGGALRDVLPALKSDYEIVLAAVRQTGLSLNFATDELRAEREIVLAAVSADGPALA